MGARGRRSHAPSKPCSCSKLRSCMQRITLALVEGDTDLGTLQGPMQAGKRGAAGPQMREAQAAALIPKPHSTTKSTQAGKRGHGGRR